jgi:multiple antibiotic resistance protein
MDSIGNVSYFLEILKDIDPKRQKMIIIREMLIALVTMILFYFIGNFLLEQLEVSETTVRVASGVILFLVAIKILYPSTPSLRASLRMEGEPFIVPMAIPLIAGPSVLATIMLYAHDDELSKYVLPAIAIAWVFSVIILLLSPYLEKFLGKNGLTAFERLLGMVLVLLSIQRLLEGIQLFTKVYAPKAAFAVLNLLG